jgi:nucleoside-diphosphate-sugar epimerase
MPAVGRTCRWVTSSPYAQSKIASEKVARRLQDAGRPVVTIYPGAVYGSHDPYRGEQSEMLRWILLGRFPLWPQGGLHVVDVRDTAAVIQAVLRPGGGPRRYVVPGHYLQGDVLYRTLAATTGRRLPHLIVPGVVIGLATRLISAVQRRLPDRWRYPADREGAEIIRRSTRFDDSAARKELGVEPRPFTQTITDMVRWLVESGRVPARYAGKLGRTRAQYGIAPWRSTHHALADPIAGCAGIGQTAPTPVPPGPLLRSMIPIFIR